MVVSWLHKKNSLCLMAVFLFYSGMSKAQSQDSAPSKELQLGISALSVFRPEDKTPFVDAFTIPVSLFYKISKNTATGIYGRGGLHFYHTHKYLPEYNESQYRFIGFQAEFGYQWKIKKLNPAVSLAFAGGWSSKRVSHPPALLYKNINTFHTNLLLSTSWLYQVSTKYKIGVEVCFSHKYRVGTKLILNYAF